MIRQLWLMALVVQIGSSAAVTANKAFYHQGKCVDQLVLYLDQVPRITTYSAAGVREYRLEIDQIVPAAWNMLRSLKSKPGYYIRSQFKNGRLRLQINFDSQVVAHVAAARFKPISQPAGVLIKIEKNGTTESAVCHRPSSTKVVVLDFGHGGHDFGTKVGDLIEKDLVRAIGLKLAKMLHLADYQVHLTRSGDRYLALDERTYLANLNTQAAIFVSLHVNHAANPLVAGLETFYLHRNLLNEIDLENRGPKSYAHRQSLNQHSAQLAQVIHQNLLQMAQDYKLVDRKVRQAVSQVLLGVEMPAILVELGFLSNRQEAQLLANPKYQACLAEGIKRGIDAYFSAAAF